MTTNSATEPRLEEYTQSLREDSFVALLRSLGIAGMILLCGSLISNSRGVLALPVSGVFLVTYWLSNFIRIHGSYRWAVAMFLTARWPRSPRILLLPAQRKSVHFLHPAGGGDRRYSAAPARGFCSGNRRVAAAGRRGNRSGDRLQILQLPFLASVMLGYLSATVALLASQSFFAAVEWAIDSYHKVERREMQLFESEKKLQRALHEKEYLNSQLSASNKELERARALAEYANRMKSQFVANMGHQLRTPLNAIIGFSYILKQELKGPLCAEQQDYMSRIYDLGNYLLKLLNDVLDDAKLEAGRIDLQCEPTPLEPVVLDAQMTASSLALGKSIELRQEFAVDLPLVYIDRMRVAQVLLNLLSNAVKFTDQGVITIRAYPTPAALRAANGDAWDRDAYVVVEIEDTGIGIAKEH